MVTKIKKAASAAKSAAKSAAQSAASSAANSPLAGSVKDSAQQIWLAGLGAFSRAQEEGGKVFEQLVRQGVSLQRKTQAVAEEKLNEASTRMASMATDISSKASGQWDKLEGIFEERVSKALKKLGVPTASDVEALIARVDELNRQVARLQGGSGKATGNTGKATAKAAKAPARKRPAAKKASAKKAASA